MIPLPSARPAAPARPGRGTVALLALVVILLIAIVVAPGVVAEQVGRSAAPDIANLPDVVARGFADWVASGAAAPGATLSPAVDFWRVFHGVKAVLAIGLLAVLVVLNYRILLAYWTSDVHGRRLSMLGGAGSAVLTGLAIVLVIANVQGTVAPLSSVLSFLPTTPRSPAAATVRDQLADGSSTPVTTALIDDFRLYHAAVVVCAVLVGIGLIGAAALIRVRWSRLPPARRRRGQLVLAELPPAVFAVFVGVVLAANLSTVLDTEPALAAFLDGVG